MKFSYKALSAEQITGGKKIVTFSAPATDINLWGGIPQKKKFDLGEESAGFQREESPTRLKNIAEFLKNPTNTVQNSLLCSVRESENCSFMFVPLESEDGNNTLGHFEIEMPDFSSMSLLQLFGRVQDYLEKRVPELKGRKPSEETITKLQELARDSGALIDDIEEQTNGSDAVDDGTAAIFDQSHIVDFWDEIASRRIILAKIPDFSSEEFLGFSREALESYLKPVVVVDGQHRLRGALLAAKESLSDDAARTEAELLIDSGITPDEAESRLLKKFVRSLPITLLLDTDPAEHVFQFVVVNQKATPIGRALLGTIVSTSLTDSELVGVADRLRNAGIPLDESRSASYMARDPNSPFCNLVELGMSNDNANLKLQWSVFVSLVNLFKNLNGATPYHESTDYARAWKNHHLAESEIVSEYSNKDFDTPYDYWKSNDGPWRSVFICFWTEIRDRFSNLTDDQARNYWGNPRRSNLFNKIYLNILASDFFKYLRANRITINGVDELKATISSWLDGVDNNYFARDWELEKTGVKKDSPGIRSKWSKIWDEYRLSPESLPDRTKFRKPSTV